MRVRSITLRLAAAAALALLALPSPAFAQTGGSSGSAGLSHPKPPAATAAKTSCTRAASSPVKRCTRVQRTPLSALSSSQRAERSSILKARAAKAKAAQASPAAAAALPSAPAACAGWSTRNPDRFDSCADQVWTLYTYTVSTSGVETITGTFSFEDQQWTTYSASSKSWTHGVFVIGYNYNNTGDLASGFNGYLESNCSIATGTCTAVSLNSPTGLDPQSVRVTPGSQQEFAWKESDTGPSATTAGAQNILDGYLGVNWEVTFLPPLIFYDTAQLVGRCDTMVNLTDGCVDQDFAPTMYPSYAADGASADMINFYETKVAPYYGNPSAANPLPLHRLTDPVLSGPKGNNRQIICGDGSFTQDSTMNAQLAPYSTPTNTETDSCDEYPFAGSYESGAMEDGADGNPKPYVTTGANCVQVTANHTDNTNTNEPQDWATVTVTGNYTAGTSNPCIRGHIPGLLNSHVGSEYSALISPNRLIDKDAFWVKVTGTPPASP